MSSPPPWEKHRVHALLELLLEATVGGARRANTAREYDSRGQKREREFPTPSLAGARSVVACHDTSRAERL